MAVWTIEPFDTVIFRDGRPFNATPGAKAITMQFPFPSTIAGGVRTRAGLDNAGVFQKSKINEVKAISIKGPFLVELKEDSSISSWLLPAPLDAVLLKADGDEKAIIKQLIPIEVPKGVYTDLEAFAPHLTLVGMASPDSQKPHSKAPRFCYWGKYKNWLLEPKDNEIIRVNEYGHNGASVETRTHVKITQETQTAEEGALFQTSGLRFTHSSGDSPTLSVEKLQRLAIALETKAAIHQGLAPLGGERRLVTWQKSNVSLPFEKCPTEIADKIVETGTCRVILLTPGYFENIINPAYLQKLQQNVNVTPTVKAIAVARPQVISGWDFENNRPKPTRRLAPAGTVFFLDLGTKDKTLIKNWIDVIWMNSISDTEQDRRDSFGLAVLGTWSGKNQEMETK